MNFKLLVLTIFIGAFISCESKIDEKLLTTFQIPQIVNSAFNDSIKSQPFLAEFITENFAPCVGKFRFQSIIDINPEKIDSIRIEDFIGANTDTHITNKLDVNGFELIVDYNTSIKYNQHFPYDSILYDHFPVYFVNSTKKDKIFYGKDRYVFGIQEAIDNEDFRQWRPIEGRGFDFCGNGHWRLIVHPHEFVMILMKKYEGDYETDLRVRFQVGENILVSVPFKGRINKSQFSIGDNSYIKRQLKESSGAAASWLFYGATPNEEIWAGKTR